MIRVRYKVRTAAGAEAGTEADLEDGQALDLVAAGQAVIVPGPKSEAARAAEPPRRSHRPAP